MFILPIFQPKPSGWYWFGCLLYLVGPVPCRFRLRKTTTIPGLVHFLHDHACLFSFILWVCVFILGWCNILRSLTKKPTGFHIVFVQVCKVAIISRAESGTNVKWIAQFFCWQTQYEILNTRQLDHYVYMAFK